MDHKEARSTVELLPDRSRRYSVKETIATGFETTNVLTGSDKPNQGQNPHGDSTTFASTGFDVYYRPSDGWEGLHRYDPEFVWEPSEERKLVRKVTSPPMALSCS